ncbi:MAG TPA: hypothetical protein VH684_16315 [Xanthobacteraceae bacterium]|jgi:hypothetical protein
MRWVTAKQLEDWAGSIGSEIELPKIVSDLIRASAPDLASIRFPSGDKGRVRGFDGHLVSEIAALNVPLGRSYWELGTNENYKTKAKGDFEKRTEGVPLEDQRDATLVLVSPWTWDSSDKTNKLEDFIADCRRSSSWKDIRYIDGVQLEAWLEHRPGVAAWHARNTLKLYAQDGIRSTDDFWDDFSGRFGPPITEEVLLCERAKAAEELVKDLFQRSNTVSLVADSPDEALAFAIAAIRKAAPEVRLFLESRTLVVETVAAGRQLRPEGNLVLLLRGDPAKSPRQFLSVGTILVPLGRQQRGGGSTILERPTSYAMGVAMRSMGLEENRAISLARGSGRSLTALARLIPGGSYDPPSWTHRAQELVPAILSGAWDSANPRDTEIIELIAGAPSIDVENRLRRFLVETDPPFDLEATVWKVRAPMDAFVWVGPLIGAHQAGLLRSAMLKVFGDLEPEPKPEDEVSFFQEKPNGYSEWLREGLTTTILLFAVWGEIAGVNLGGTSGQDFANRVLKDLPGLNSNPRLLTSLRDELPMLAEAAPDPLLAALERLLEGDGRAILPIFEERPGFLHAVSHHSGILWALETLAWDPMYFRRAVLILAKLASIDPGGETGNRPDRSLAEIFVLWNPNTHASSAQRLSTLDEITRAFPAVGWDLVLTLLPSFSGVSTPTAKPRLREAGAADRPAVTYAELWANQGAVAERAIVLAGRDVGRWLALVKRIASFAPTERAKAVSELDQTLGNLDERPRKALWTKLRDEVARHQRFAQAPWALKAEELEPLRSLSEKYAPADPVSSVISMFDSWALDDTSDVKQSEQRRSAAIKGLFAKSGAEAVVRLATEAKTAYLVVEALAGASLTAEEIEQLLTLAFDQQPSSSFTYGMSALYRNVVGAEQAEGWIRRTQADRALTAQSVAQLLEAWPDDLETWQTVRKFGPEVVYAYWKEKPPRYLKGPRRELLRSVLMLLRYGRAIEAIQSSLDRMRELPSKLIFRALDGVIPQLNTNPKLADTMTSYYVESAFKVLDERSDVEADAIARREYGFFPLLEHSSRALKVHALMASDPAVFHSILRNVYRGNTEATIEVDETTKANARLSYSLLSHFSLLPGAGAQGVDRSALAAWVDEVRRLGAETDRARITDDYVGKTLAHAPPDPDGAWPHRAVRDEIERLASEEIENAIQIERYNMRGVHSRGAYEGGVQERDLANTNYQAAALSSAWPRTAALLQKIAKTWEEEAKRVDIEAAQRRMRS